MAVIGWCMGAAGCDVPRWRLLECRCHTLVPYMVVEAVGASYWLG